MAHEPHCEALIEIEEHIFRITSLQDAYVATQGKCHACKEEYL